MSTHLVVTDPLGNSFVFNVADPRDRYVTLPRLNMDIERSQYLSLPPEMRAHMREALEVL
jgi:hypothetical protein